MSKFNAGAAALAVSSFILFLSAVPSTAATITLKSVEFSASKPVPHFHYEGEVAIGDLERIVAALDQYVDCAPETLPEAGGNCAVVTLTSEGGNYIEGLKIARFFRASSIATWVRSGSYCYSACAFAFLGGSGHSSSQSIGDYIDRTVEPGAILGFHAPYVTADSLGELVAQLGIEEVLGGNRESIALMIQELVNWNVEEGVLARITNMGSEDAYIASNAQDLYLLRTSLPQAPRRFWAAEPAEALRNACMRLLAYHEDVWPSEMQDRLRGEIAYDIGTDDAGRTLAGYRIVDNPGGLTISYCATPASDAHLGADADIALFYGPGIQGTMRPALTFFHRPEGWSTLGTGGTATQRIFQRGTLGHFFMPPDAELGGALSLTWRLVGDDLLKTGRLGR